MSEFHLDPDAATAGTHYLGTIVLAPTRLIERFGPPSQADGYKISGRYTFADDASHVYTLYDWKATSLYNDAMMDGEPSGSRADEFSAERKSRLVQHRRSRRLRCCAVQAVAHWGSRVGQVCCPPTYDYPPPWTSRGRVGIFFYSAASERAARLATNCHALSRAGGSARPRESSIMCW